MLNYLLCFFLGMIFIQFVVPFFDAWITHIATWFEYKKLKFSEAINEGNIRMKRALSSAEEDDTPKYTIGFAVPACDEEIEEEDDIDYDT